MRKVRTAILISGRGSNMLALAKAAQSPDFPAKICLVMSNVPEALGLQKAADLGIPVEALDHKDFSDRVAFDKALDKRLKAYNIELVCCAGYMRILSSDFVQDWPNRILNIHPSLLPKYKGLNTHERALVAGDEEHGCTVHFVNEELDGGAIINQSKIAISPTDTVESLTNKVLALEHPLYIQSLKSVAKSIE